MPVALAAKILISFNINSITSHSDRRHGILVSCWCRHKH